VPGPAWQKHDATLPLNQGDLVLVSSTKTLPPQEKRRSANRLPTLGERDGFDQPYWSPGSAELLEMWGLFNYALAVVISQGCAIDNEYFQRRDLYRKREAPETADARADVEHERDAFVSVAEAWPVESLPEHVQQDAENGALGYVPFRVDSLRPDDKRLYSVDLSRLSTVAARSIDLRVGIADEPWRLKLQSALCKYFAARTIRLAEQLETLVASGIVGIEALEPPRGNPPRARVRVRFGDGRDAVLEAIVPEVDAPAPQADDGPSGGFSGRRKA